MDVMEQFIILEIRETCDGLNLNCAYGNLTVLLHYI